MATDEPIETVPPGVVTTFCRKVGVADPPVITSASPEASPASSGAEVPDGEQADNR